MDADSIAEVGGESGGKSGRRNPGWHGQPWVDYGEIDGMAVHVSI